MVSTREIEQIGLLGEQDQGSFGRDPAGLNLKLNTGIRRRSKDLPIPAR